MYKKLVIGAIVAIIAIVAAVVGIVYNSNEQKNNKEESEIQEINVSLKEDTVENKSTKKNTNTTTTKNKEKKETTKTKEEKILIAYFSRADENYNVGTVKVGNTEIMAGYIKDYLSSKADTFKIEPKSPYPTNYEECKEVASVEKSNNTRPKFKGDVENISQYDTIFIGYPIWCGDLPMIINTFLEKYDLSGKTIIPFNTHEGSGDSGTYKTIKNKLKSSNVNTNGLAIQGKETRKDSAKTTVENWLKDLGY